MKLTQVHVRLLDEGTECWRPVSAKAVEGGVFKILGIVPAGETWEFPPASLVHCKDKVFSDGSRGLVAYETAAL